MATAALRGLLVVAALALGFLVLSKAFPGSGEPPTTGTPGGGGAITTVPPTSPSPVQSPVRQAPQPKDPSEIRLQVLNGTDVAGLASDTADVLEEEGYDIVTVDDAEGGYDVTTIFYVPKRKVDAQLLRDAFFQTASLEVADEQTAKIDITVILGADYASQVSGEDGASPEESPT